MGPSSLPAGFWKRLAAWFIDMIILSFAFGIVQGVFVVSIALSDNATMGHSHTMLLDGGVPGLIYTLLCWLYFALMESSQRQATVGKMLLGIKVTDLMERRVSFAKATGRYFGKYLSALFFGFGFLMIAFTKHKQGLHDKLAGCYVLRRDTI